MKEKAFFFFPQGGESSQAWRGRITIDPKVCHGKPVVRGLRYPVEMILGLAASGMSVEEILADYPDLEREDIQAAFAFGAYQSRVRGTFLAAE